MLKFSHKILISLSTTDDSIDTYTTLRINARNFYSNKDVDTSVNPNGQYYDDVTVTWNSSTKKWKYSKFTNSSVSN